MIYSEELLKKTKELFDTGEYVSSRGIQWTRLCKALKKEFPDEIIVVENFKKNRKVNLLLGNCETEVKEVIKEREPDDYKRLEVENQKLIKRVTNHEADLQNIFRVMYNCADRLKVKPIPLGAQPKPIKSETNQEFHTQFSDVHVGSKILYKETMNLSDYNKEECIARVRRYVDGLIKFKEQDEKSHGLNTLVMYFEGDLTEGMNVYPGQAFHVCLNALQQIFFAGDLFKQMLVELAHHFVNVDIYFVPGNHGTDSKSANHHWSWLPDYLVGYYLHRVLSDIKSIRMFISDSPRMMVQRGDFDFFLTHSGEVQSWNGIPYYGLDRMIRRIPNMTGIIPDYVLTAHNHMPGETMGGQNIQNGCFPGGSNLSVNKMTLYSRPSQRIWYFHKEHGVNRATNLWLAPMPKLETDKNGIYTSYNSLAEGELLNT